MPNSPAGEAGIKPGDVIVAFDGKPVASLSLPELIAFTRLPVGSVVHLSVVSAGTAARDVTLTLRELLCNRGAPTCSPSVAPATR